jgi:hypothetical protein
LVILPDYPLVRGKNSAASKNATSPRVITATVQLLHKGAVFLKRLFLTHQICNYFYKWGFFVF